MYCPKCGNQVGKESIYCSKCGGNLKEVSASNLSGQSENLKKNNKIAIGGAAVGLLAILCVIGFWVYRMASDTKESSASASGTVLADAETINEIIETDETEWRNAYSEKVQEFDDKYNFDLIYLDNDDIPELVADWPGYSVSVFTFADGEIFIVMDEYSYGAGGNLGYQYLPRGNTILNYNNDMAGDVVYEYYMTVDDDHKVVDVYDETLSIWNFKDTNGNNQIDEGELSVDEPYYYYGDTEITAQEYSTYQISGDYEGIYGTKSAEEILLLLTDNDVAVEDNNLYYHDIPLSSLMGARKDAVLDMLGNPQSDDWNMLSYEDISLGYDGTTTEIYYIHVDTKAFKFKDNTLDKDRTELINLLGEPIAESWNESEEYQRNFIVSDFFVSFSLKTDDENEIATYATLFPNDDEESGNSYKNEQETEVQYATVSTYDLIGTYSWDGSNNRPLTLYSNGTCDGTVAYNFIPDMRYVDLFYPEMWTFLEYEQVIQLYGYYVTNEIVSGYNSYGERANQMVSNTVYDTFNFNVSMYGTELHLEYVNDSDTGLFIYNKIK